MQLNCIPGSETLQSLHDLEAFVSLEIAPVAANANEEGETHCETTDPLTADFWTIYGRDKDGLATALHDEEDPQELARALLFVTKELGLPVSYFDTKRGHSNAYTLLELAEHLTWVIHDELDVDEENDDLDVRFDAFDNHELSPLREAICEISGYNGN